MGAMLLPPREDPAVSGDSKGVTGCVLIPRQDKGLVYSMKVLLILNLSLSSSSSSVAPLLLQSTPG